ncbi:Protein of unknown function [Pyronema omphalodes CBS 100304]|uniref:Uncharacterized protein n=1 Tax=Pyronema omphalodes (strain CBS 100304) TaxID=1076935 RepID=U4LAZ3_PYROM|nr:Protein of unknown function [Pyronema omphalodes CBS 100304]
MQRRCNVECIMIQHLRTVQGEKWIALLLFHAAKYYIRTCGEHRSYRHTYQQPRRTDFKF